MVCNVCIGDNMITQKDLKQIPQLYETDGEQDKIAYLHFTLIGGHGDWYVCEYKQEEEDILFYGYVNLFAKEWGYFTLNELSTVPTIVLDQDFKPTRISEVQK